VRAESALPTSGARQPRVMPTARTMVVASTNSTALARNAGVAAMAIVARSTELSLHPAIVHRGAGEPVRPGPEVVHLRRHRLDPDLAHHADERKDLHDAFLGVDVGLLPLCGVQVRSEEHTSELQSRGHL